MNARGQILYYEECLRELYGQNKIEIPRKAVASKAEERNLKRIKWLILEYCKKMKYTLQTLFRILDRDDGSDIDVQELERALVGKVE